MKIIKLKLFTFDELSNDAKQAAINDWRNSSLIDYEFGDELDDYATSGTLSGTGFIIDKVSFTGFYSQCDGASFIGYYDSSQINLENLKGFSLKAYDLMARNDSIFGASGLTSDNVITADVKRISRNYNHENTASVENIEINGIEWSDFDDDDRYNKAFEAIENYLTALKNSLCDLIYSSLQSEYEYQNSDEYISETLTINEYYFTDKGKLYHA